MTDIPPPPGTPLGAIDLTLQGSVMSSSVVPPSVRVNGYPVNTSYGSNVIPMPPGRHRVDVHAQWMRQYGQASIDVDVRSNEASPVFYAAPWHQFTTGSIGTTKQKRKGGALFVGILGGIAVFVGLLLGLAFF